MPNWGDVLDEINQYAAQAQHASASASDVIRRKYLDGLFNYTGRNVIAYYSGWLSKPGLAGTEINDEDKNGFMMAIHKMDRSMGLDLILHTPGGDIASTQSLVDYLRQMFDRDMRAIVPQIAMSAGTALACSCRQIVLAKHSNLGPIDPHLRGIPAAGVKDEFKRACQEVKADPATLDIWKQIIGQYRPTFLSQCENAIKWSNDFVREQLATVMFHDRPDGKKLAASIVKKLSGFSSNRTHSRHIHFEECRQMGLDVVLLEDDEELQDLVLTVHHCFMHALMNTPSFKIIENHEGVASLSVAQQVIVQGPSRVPLE